MSIDEYKKAVIELFQSGRATDQMWEEMASAVLYVSENDGELVTAEIDSAVYSGAARTRKETDDERTTKHSASDCCASV